MKTTPTKRRSVIWKLPKAEFQELVDKSDSLRDILRKIGSPEKGNNWVTLKNRIKEENIDLSKLDENRTRRIANLTFQKTIPLEECLVEGSDYSRTNLKARLIRSGLLKNECSKCGQGPEWKGEPLSLQLDHINGVSNDNRIENLRILCPNCHSQTASFAGRKNKVSNNCQDCGKKIQKVSKRCDKCAKVKPKLTLRRVVRPSKEELNILLWSKPTLHIARAYGVTDNAVAKWAKSYGLSKPPRGYWGFK